MEDVTPKSALATIIHVMIEAGDEGLFYATSPEMPGLLVAEQDVDSLKEEVPKVIREMFRAKDRAGPV